MGFTNDLIRSKLNSFSHTEYSKEHLSNPLVLKVANDFVIDHLSRIGEGFGLLKYVDPEILGDFGDVIVEEREEWLSKPPQVSKIKRVVASTLLNLYRKTGEEDILLLAYKGGLAPRWVFAFFLAVGHSVTNFSRRLSPKR